MLDNALFALVIPLIQHGLNGILATNYSVVTAETGSVLTAEAGTAIQADTVAIPVVQAYQPVFEGVNTQPTIYIYKVGDQRIGFPKKYSRWVTDYQSQIATEGGQGIETESGIGIDADGDSVATMVHTEIQRYATTFQISALSTQNPATPMQLTASDLVNYAVAVLQSDVFVSAIEAVGVGILRIGDIRDPYFTDDRGQFEASPSADFVLAHNQILISTSPIITSKTLRILPV